MEQTRTAHIQSLLREGMSPKQIRDITGYNYNFISNVKVKMNEPRILQIRSVTREVNELVTALTQMRLKLQGELAELKDGVTAARKELAGLRAEIAVLRGLDPHVTDLRVLLLQADDPAYPDRKRRNVRRSIRTLMATALAEPVRVADIVEPAIQLAD